MATIDKIIPVSTVLVETVDGILPKCGEGGIEILINLEQEENQDYGNMGCQVSKGGIQNWIPYFCE